MQIKRFKKWVALFSCTCLVLSSMVVLSVPAFAVGEKIEYETTTFVSPKRLWGNESVGDVTDLGSCWIYEASSNKDGNFVVMTENEYTNQPVDYEKSFSDQLEATASLVSLWNGFLYLQTGWYAGSRDVSQTFIVPRDGVLNVEETIVERNFGIVENPDNYIASVEIAIYLNDTKIWPADNSWAIVGNEKNQPVCNKLTVPALSDICVSSGDKVRFVVNAGENANYSDYVQWPVTLQLDPPKLALNYSQTSYASPTVPTVEGMQDIGTRWIYEYSTGKNADFALMAKDKELPNIADQQAFYAGAPAVAGAAKATLQYLYNKLFLMPNYYGDSINAVQTFVVPETGKLSVDATTVLRHFGMDKNDCNYGDIYAEQNVHIAIFLNETKVWPVGDAWESVGYDSAVYNRLSIAELPELNVRKGDKLRFVVNSGTVSNTFHYNDWVEWPVTVNMFVPTNGSASCEYAENGEITTDVELADIGDTVTVNVVPADGYQLKAGSLKYIVGGKIYPITEAGAEKNTFVFAMPAGAAVVQAEFIPLTAHNMAVLGASYKENNTRFVSRAYRKAGDAALIDSGHYVMRVETADMLFGGAVDGAALRSEQIATLIDPANNVLKVQTTKLVYRCDDYVDFALRINGAGNEAYKNQKYAYVSYAVYEDGTTVYSNVCVRSYMDINLNAASKVEAVLKIPPFSEENASLKNNDYTIQVRLQNGEWQPITPYLVKNCFGENQNLTVSDPVRECPMISFEMGNVPVEVRIKWKKGPITNAEVHPLAFSHPVSVVDGEAFLTITEPKELTVEINQDRYEKVYIFANPLETGAPTESTDTVRVFKNGLTKLPKVGTNVWKGGLSDIRIYDRALSETEVKTLVSGSDVSGVAHAWKLDKPVYQTSGITAVGEPKFQEDYYGRKATVFNGFEDAIQTGAIVNMSKDFTISSWVYLDPSGEGAKRVILFGLLFVRSDGTIGSDIGDWQFPYVSKNKLTSGAWHQVTLTKQGDLVTAYIDGVSGGTEERTAAEGDLYVTLGSSHILNGAYLRDNQTFYLEPGAVVRGTLYAYGVKNVAIKGLGIIDVTPSTDSYYTNGILCAFSDGVTIDGVTVNNPSSFNLSLGQSKNVKVNNFKCFSSYGASDGINTKACENVRIENSFISSNDDALSVYATSVDYLGSTKNYKAYNNILTSGVHMAIHGQEFGNDEVSDITIKKLYILNNATRCASTFYQGMLSVNAGNGVTARDIRFDTVHIEDLQNNQLFNVRVFMNPNYNKEPGRLVEDVTYANIFYTGLESGINPAVISGNSTERVVRNLTFENVLINGNSITDNWFEVGPYVENMVIK